MKTWHFALAAFALSHLAAERADACGGLFCSATSPTPVDQAAERIIFVVNDDGSVTATVEIKYQGNPQDFSWIVPVSGTPDFVEVAGKDELQLLDLATANSFIPPTVTGCSNGGGDLGGIPGFACDEALSAPVADNAGGEGGGIRVTEYPSVGPFDDIVVVEGGEPRVLQTWLQDHGYQVSDGMLPFMGQYTVEGYKFLATRLRADAEVQDMVPIRFHCPQPDPEIPLRLTAIAAEPQMGFIVFVVGPRRYTTLNYVEVALDSRDIRLDAFGQTNYQALVSKRIDEAGGLGFVVERAQSAATTAGAVGNVFLGTETEEESRATLREILRDDRYVTRFYGRMDGDEMIEDPIFVARPEGDTAGDVTTLLDLSAQEYDNCTVPPMPVCGGLYCGLGHACAGSELGDGCVCRGGNVARSITSPTGGQTVACSSLAIDLHSAGTDACSGVVCGLGSCIPVNDRPACSCDDGAVAVIDRGSVTCVPATTAVIENDQILWPQPEDVGGCVTSVRGQQVGGALSLALLFGSGLALRRRRR